MVLSQIGCIGTKHNQKIYENSLRPSGTRQGKSSSKSCSTDKLFINKTKEQIVEHPTGQEEQFDTSTFEVNSRGQQNLASSPHLGSVVLDNKLSAENKLITDANRNLGAKSSFPGDSVTEPSLPQNEVIVSSREEDAIDKSCGNCAEPSRLSRARDQVNHFISQASLCL